MSKERPILIHGGTVIDGNNTPGVRADAVRELKAFGVNKPIILTETGAVKPSHTGCSTFRGYHWSRYLRR